MRYLPILLILIFVHHDAHAQRWKRDRNHAFFGLGPSGFMGDLGGANKIGTHGLKDFDFSAIRPAMSVGYQYVVLQNIAVTGNLAFGFISGNDQHTLEAFRNNRNIHFRSPLLELSGNLQYYFLNVTRDGARHRIFIRNLLQRRIEFRLYGFAGIGGFYFSPQGYFEPSMYRGSIPADLLPPSGWYNLRKLNTEGQGYLPERNTYLPISLSIPFGLGVIVPVSREISIGFEFGLRKTFTDYIDDVSTTYIDPTVFSERFDDPAKIALAEYFANPTLNTLGENITAPGQQRGNPLNDDAYMFSFIKIYYRLAPLRPSIGLPRF